MTELTSGTLLKDNLRLDRKLGSGAMGTVWVAHNVSLGADVAVKVLSRGVSNAQARNRFEQEARASARLDNPHIVRVYDYGVTDNDEPFIVMELLRGEDLRTHIEERGPLSPERTALLIGQICRGLSQAHAQQVIHRDIKPANVFVIDNNGEPFVKLLDFGVAKHNTDHDLGMTETGAMMGTPYYMSPEQLLDPRRVDVRTDLWAVGVVTYACLTRTLPFHGETLGALSVAIHQGEYAAITEHRPELPEALDAWMKRALAQSPDKRFQTAQELSAALDIAVAGAATGRTSGVSALGDKPSAMNDAPTEDAARATAPTSAAATTGLDASTDTSWIARGPRRNMRSWLGIGGAMAAVGVLGWWLGRMPAETAASSAGPTATASDTAVATSLLPGEPEPDTEPSVRADAIPPPAPSTAAPPATAATIAIPATAPTKPPVRPRPTTTTRPQPAPSATRSAPVWDKPFYTPPITSQPAP